MKTRVKEIEPEWLRPKEVAILAGVSVRTVWAACRRQELTHRYTGPRGKGRKLFIPLKSARAWARKREHGVLVHGTVG